MTPAEGEAIVGMLRDRDGRLTLIHLADGRQCRVFNIVWGRDMAAEFDHITTNISPSVETEAIDFFHTDQVRRVADADTGRVLFEDNPSN
ncbi:MAG: hypothetical protein ABI725_06000 [Chloroflexota bacterium]